MKVDSFRFLPRSFRPLYENAQPASDEAEAVWAAPPKRLGEMQIALLTSAGLYEQGAQTPFDLDRERREPGWGDPGWRPLHSSILQPGRLGMAHLHVNAADVLRDPGVAFPLRLLDELAAGGVVGGVAREHVSVMGYQEVGLAAWRAQTGPEIIAMLKGQEVDGLVLAPV